MFELMDLLCLVKVCDTDIAYLLTEVLSAKSLVSHILWKQKTVSENWQYGVTLLRETRPNMRPMFRHIFEAWLLNFVMYRGKLFDLAFIQTI